MTNFPSIFLINEEAVDATNEAGISASKAPRNPPSVSCFMFHCFGNSID